LVRPGTGRKAQRHVTLRTQNDPNRWWPCPDEAQRTAKVSGREVVRVRSKQACVSVERPGADDISEMGGGLGVCIFIIFMDILRNYEFLNR
jgi:hypothetical protein